VSTILNALKKLEQESLAEEAEHPQALNIHLRQEKNLWKEKHAWVADGTKPLLWGILLTLLVLGAIALFTLITGRFQGETPPTNPTPRATPMQPAIPPEVSLPKESPPPVPKRKIPLTVPPAKPAESPPREKLKPAMPKIAGTKPGMAETKQVMAGTKPRMAETKPIIAEITPEEPPSPRHDTVDKEIRLLGDRILKINAISWSQQADERLAVINSAIVREGQTVEGFRLVKIMENGVIVQRAGQKNRVDFRLR
jgi:hypothetical protein